MENMTLQQRTRYFLAVNGIRPKKRLGQHFLINPDVLAIILEAAELTDADTVIEIGAGLGSLTAALAAHAKRVIAIEVDGLLYQILESQFGALASRCAKRGSKHRDSEIAPTFSRVQLIHADILKLELGSLLESGRRTKVIANLPYSITTPILWKLLAHHEQIDGCVLMMQKEVAARIVAAPGGKEYGALTIGVSYYAEPTLIGILPPEDFYPAPKVDSALLKLRMRETPKVAVDNEELFFKIVRTAFRTRRKMLKNALARGRFASAETLSRAFNALGIAPQRRAETLDIAEFAALANFLSFLAE